MRYPARTINEFTHLRLSSNILDGSLMLEYYYYIMYYTEDSTKVEALCDRLSLLRTSNIPKLIPCIYNYFMERLIFSVNI